MKLYIYAAALLAALATLGASHWFAYQAGENSERVLMQNALNSARDKEAKAIEELEHAKLERQVVYRDRIKVVAGALDATGCFDRPLPDPVLDSLRTERRP